MSNGDSTLLLKPTLLVIGAIIGALVIALAANGLLAFLGGGGIGSAESGGGDITKLPGNWSGEKWYSEDLRDQGMRYKNETAGDEIQFVPKQMNNSTLPEDENRRELVKRGRELFANTSAEAPEHVGNDLSCANCHGGGDLPTVNGMVGQDIDLIPLVGTAAGYPEWTGRTERMRDMRQRIQGCFLRSMNAPNSTEGVPAYDSREIQAMESYLVWLNKGTPSGRVPYWRHIEKPEGKNETNVSKVNPVRGADLYLQNCASCHGADGQGTEGQYPPLWGPESYNDGAGMGRLYTSAGFIREAMPYGSAHTFTDWQDVQDVAGFVNAHKRPHLPRQPKDWKASGSPDEGIYYNRTQQRLGYDMNPMTKKLMLAGVPIGSESLNQSDIPNNVKRYDKPLRNESANGSWQTTWILPTGNATANMTANATNGSATSNASTTGTANTTTDGNASSNATAAIRDTMASAMNGDGAERESRGRVASETRRATAT
ncbi:class I cytochrome c [Halococcus morrhuae DSM 1307]|uniref:Class I cytochrome c n=1 Tax=Halococcus morrhuae DSM 1307 TaxID=931277 RepID=M0MQX1_HALMO|nr:class I cytochrome c [Halococcus morrhuae DSM 1307]